MQEGELLGISPTTAMPSGLSALGQEVFTALKTYGAYVVDVAGGDTAIRVQSNAFDSVSMTALWHDLGSILPLLGAVTVPAAHPAPTISAVSATGSKIVNGNGVVGIGATIHLSVKFSEKVFVTGSPSLALNSGGTAKYASGSGTSTLQFTYVVKSGQNATDLAIAGFHLAGVADAAGTAVNLAGAPTDMSGTLTIRTSAAASAFPPTSVGGSLSLGVANPQHAINQSNAGVTLDRGRAVVNDLGEPLAFDGGHAGAGRQSYGGSAINDPWGLSPLAFADWHALHLKPRRQPRASRSRPRTAVAADERQFANAAARP